MKFSDYLDRFNSAINCRRVLSTQEIKGAARDGVKPETLAETNDSLARDESVDCME